MYESKLTVTTQPPFELDLTVWVLRRRSKNVTDSWDGKTYSRIVVVNDSPISLEVSQAGTGVSPRLDIKLKSKKSISQRHKDYARQIVRKLFGLDVDLQPFYKLVACQPELKLLDEQFRGVRPTRYPTIFEGLVNAIACQQVSLDAGIAALNRMTETYGLSFTDHKRVHHAFPRPEDLIDVSEEALRQLGLSYQKARAIKELAYASANGDINFDQLETVSNQEAVAYLATIRGIGRWSAEYVLLRGLGRLDVFPGDDIGGQNNIQRLLGLEARPDYQQLKDLTSAWQPYAGLVYFHLLLAKLRTKGLV